MRPAWPISEKSSAPARGFTLFEMLAVILLIGVAITITAVSVSRGLAGARVVAASNEIVAALRATRTQAIVRNQQTLFELDTRAARYRGVDGRGVDLPSGMTVGITSAREDQLNDHVSRIRFFPDGSSTGGRITLHQGRREWHVNVSWLTGTVSVVGAAGAS